MFSITFIFAGRAQVAWRDICRMLGSLGFPSILVFVMFGPSDDAPLFILASIPSAHGACYVLRVTCLRCYSSASTSTSTCHITPRQRSHTKQHQHVFPFPPNRDIAGGGFERALGEAEARRHQLLALLGECSRGGGLVQRCRGGHHLYR